MAFLGESMANALIALEDLPGELLMGLDGELGAGKTTLVAGMLRALGIRTPVASPTYGLVHPYAAHTPGATRALEILHVDLYRLRYPSELDELGLLEHAGDCAARPDRVLLVEWFANAGGRLGAPDVSLALGHADGGRAVRFGGMTPLGRKLLQRLRWRGHDDLDCAGRPAPS